MSTEWFDRQVGSSVATSKEDPTMLMVSSDTPDWIGVPDEIGGGRFRCGGAFIGPCPCRAEHGVKHLVLEGTDLRVAECLDKGFLWYRMPTTKPEGADSDA
jgi:hypothetical protein